jgi:hypothetical protein
MKGIKVLAATTAVSMMLVAPSLDAGAAKKRKKKPKPPKPVTAFTDPSNDVGQSDAGALPVGPEGGFDLTKGVISQKGKNIQFSAAHSAMPDGGTLPEGFRLIWGLVVDGEVYQMTVKSLDVGKPDVVASALTQTPQGTERVGQVYEGVARLEQCGQVPLPAVLTFSTCEVLSYHTATFDAAKKTATWQIPMKAIKAKRGTQIAGGGVLADTQCFVCWVAHYAERSLTPRTILDNATPTKVYKVG